MKSFTNRIISPVAMLVRTYPGYLAVALLAVMFGLGFGSMRGNSAIVDEVAHIPAGYAYLHYGDYRLNPEHPPLMKDLAALPLQFMHLRFPDNEPAWTTAVNGQWETGWNFIYHLGNNADAILFWSRLPILLLAVAFGWVLYLICLRRWGKAVALLVVFFYALSPNLLAHSTLVTTDLGASVFMFLALVAFARFVDGPTRTNFLLLSFALALAQLAKFSAFLLYPFLGLGTLMLTWFGSQPARARDRFKTYVGGLIGASVLSVIWVWIVYIPHTWNMPDAVQDRLIAGSLVTDQLHPLVTFLSNLNNLPLMKPLVQYLLGLAMVFGRVTGGNVTYFDGQVRNGSFPGYFPELFVVKTQVALLILMVLAVIWALWRYRRQRVLTWFEQFKVQVMSHVLEWTLGGFAAFYFVVAVAGNLNLGIRHILPIYIPIFVLVALGTVKGLRWLGMRTATGASMRVVTAVLLVWYGASTILAYPSYLAYFNELIGGPAQADDYFSDSSVDWGQDLRRLKTYVDDHPQIHHIAVDYFGGGTPEYYFCRRKYNAYHQLVATAAGYDCSGTVFESWHAENGHYTGQYMAVSETFLENDRYYAAVNHRPGYDYLRRLTPIAKIGYSIYVYKLY